MLGAGEGGWGGWGGCGWGGKVEPCPAGNVKRGLFEGDEGSVSCV